MSLPTVPKPATKALTQSLPLPKEGAWLILPDEPALWYQRFGKYFLPLGPSRTLTRAYIFYLKAEDPDNPLLKLENTSKIGVASWQQHAKLWQWRERAEMFDHNMLLEFETYKDQAHQVIMESLKDAAQTLRDNLKSGRLGVAAAKEILDRGGLPGQTNIGLTRAEPYTADQLRQAEAEVAEWEQDVHGHIPAGNS